MASESTLEASASYSANLSNNPALDDGCNYKNGRTLTPPTTVSTEGYVISSGNQVRHLCYSICCHGIMDPSKQHLDHA